MYNARQLPKVNVGKFLMSVGKFAAAGHCNALFVVIHAGRYSVPLACLHSLIVNLCSFLGLWLLAMKHSIRVYTIIIRILLPFITVFISLKDVLCSSFCSLSILQRLLYSVGLT